MERRFTVTLAAGVIGCTAVNKIAFGSAIDTVFTRGVVPVFSHLFFDFRICAAPRTTAWLQEA